MRTFLRFLLPAALALGVVAGARPGDFRVLGPGGGGAMFNPTISPHDVNTVLISCDMTGSYISHDGGHSWRMFNLRGTVSFFAFDPQEPRTMYAQVTGLWRSIDNGETWKLVWPKPSTVTGVQMNSDHADETIVSSANPVGAFTAMAIDPDDSRTLVGAAKNGTSNAVWISTDHGDTWKKETDLPEPATRVWIDPRSSRNQRVIYTAGAHGVMVKRSGEWQKHSGPDGVTFTSISAGFPKTGEPLIYTTSDRGAFISRDGGASWSPVTLPGTGAKVRAVATSLHHPDSAYLSYNHLALDGKTWMGVARTSDAGKTWTLAWKDANSTAPNVHDAWIAEKLGADWGENPLALGAADQTPDVAYGTDFGRTLFTTDGGTTWNAAYSKRVPGGEWTSTGLDVTTNYGYHFDPFDQNRRFITYTDIGLSRSEDSGKSWTRSVDGVPREWTNTTYWIEFDPKVKGRVWGVMSYTHDLPRPKMWRRTPTSRYKGGVCRSDDGGRTWTVSNSGMPETAPTHILLDPASPPNRRTLYVSAFGRGVYKSIDDGHTWTLKNKGITQTDPFAWRMSRAADGTLYVLIARRSENGSIGNDGDGALYKSTDGAETWVRLKLPEGANAPNGLSIDPKDTNRLYLATWARATGMHGDGGGVFLSTDGGKSWKHVLDRDQHIYDVTIDPRNAATLYASGFESSTWRSTDRGEHWSRIPGYNFKWGHRVIPDPEDPKQIYVTTFGGSVWHGSVMGKQAPVDIVTPEMEPGR